MPLAKKIPITEMGDIRPISLTPDFGKTFEYFLSRWIMTDIKANIDPDQYGNLRGSSTSHYLVKLLDYVLKGLEKPNTLAVITLIDFKKAFDLVDHSVAVRELYLMGCRPELLPVISNFLEDREHRVLYGEALSEWQGITCGVPQGTLLGPILFLCLANSIAMNAPLHLKFVDDLSLAEIVHILTQNIRY